MPAPTWSKFDSRMSSVITTAERSCGDGKPSSGRGIGGDASLFAKHEEDRYKKEQQKIRKQYVDTRRLLTVAATPSLLVAPARMNRRDALVIFILELFRL